MDELNKQEDKHQDSVRRIVMEVKEAYENHMTTSQPQPRHYLKAGKLHSAFITDDKSLLLNVLDQLDEDETKFVLTALVDYGTPTASLDEDQLSGVQLAKEDFKPSAFILERHALKRSVRRYQLVSALVVYGGDLELLNTLIELGLDLRQQDEDGNSVLHLLVDISKDNPVKAVSAYHVIMDALPDDLSRKTLVKSVNYLQETALEVACKRCLPEMMLSLLNTSDVYKFCIGNGGTYRHFLYDITEFSNRSLTPIHYISTASEAELARMDDYRLLQKEPFATWIKEFVLVNRNITRAWMVVWFSLVVGYILTLFFILNSTPSRNTWAAHLLIVLVMSAVCGYEALTFGSTLPILKLFTQRVLSDRFPAALASGYRLMQMMFVFFATITHLLHVVSCDLSEDFIAKSVVPCLYLTNIMTGVLGLMFFTLLNNTLGHFLIVVEKISYAVFTFVSLASFYFAAFSLSFHLLHTCAFRVNCDTTNSSSVYSPTDEETSFESVPTSLYETLMLALGVTAPNEWYFASSKSSMLAVIVYVGSLMYNTLMLVNLMIAIMNERMAELCEHKKSLVVIAQLSIYTFVSDKTKTVKRRKNREAFVVHSQDGSKHYLHTMEPMLQEKNLGI